MNLPSNTRIMFQANNYISKETSIKMKAHLFEHDAIVFAKVGAAISHERKRIAYAPFLIDNNMMAFIPASSNDINFIHHLFQRLKFSKYVQLGALPSYNASDILSIKTGYPPTTQEREKIVQFLDLLAEKIDAQILLINALKKYKRGAFEAVFSQKLRLVPTDKQREWKKFKLSDFATRITRKNGTNTDIPLTISAQYGLIDQRDFFSKTVASTDMSGYYLLQSGEFAYNRSTSNEYPFGSIKRLELYPMGAVSTLYLCFAINEDVVISDLAKWYFESSQWHRGINEICAEGARNHGLLNVPTDGFFNTEHLLPSDRSEQIAIVKYLSLLQAKYDKALIELEQLNILRKALLQQLFI